MAVRREQFEFAEFAAVVVAHGTVSSPMPVTGQDFIAPFGIVVDDVMKDTGATRRSTGTDIAFRTGFTEALVDSRFQIIRIALDRRISDDFFRRQGFIGFLDDVEHDEIPIFIEHGTNSPINNFICPQFFAQSHGTVVSTKNLIFSTLPFCLRCGNTFYHMNQLPFLMYIYIYTTFKIERQ